MRWPRVTLRHLMAAVAVVALLIPVSWEVVVKTFLESLPWYVLPFLSTVVLAALRQPRLTLALYLFWGSLSGWLLVLWSRGPSHFHGSLSLWMIVLVTPIHLLGPIYAFEQYWHERTIGSGEILWACSGMAWLDLMTIPLRSHYDPTLDHIVTLARVLSAIVLWFLIVGKRPTATRPNWTHYLGWGLVEYDAIVWGWYAIGW